MSAKRDSIITTAMRLFNQYGFTNIGIDRIIDESGVAKMTFYKHFPSKNQLIRPVFVNIVVTQFNIKRLKPQRA